MSYKRTYNNVHIDIVCELMLGGTVKNNANQNYKTIKTDMKSLSNHTFQTKATTMKVEKLYKHIPHCRLYFKYNKTKKFDREYQRIKSILKNEKEFISIILSSASVIFGALYLLAS